MDAILSSWCVKSQFPRLATSLKFHDSPRKKIKFHDFPYVRFYVSVFDQKKSNEGKKTYLGKKKHWTNFWIS